MKTLVKRVGKRLAVSARYKTRIMDAKSGACIKESSWQKNLILDNGLNAWAGQSIAGLGGGTVAASFACLRIGSGTDPVKISSGAITFTQVGTTLTASGGFFTANMAGGLFKWGSGSGGVENHIASYTSATQVELVDSDTVAVPEVGVVWQVQGVALQTLLYSTNQYQTNAGDNQVTFDGVDTFTFQRTFINPVQVSSYNVNELGFCQQSTGTNVAGRLVLSATDVVGTSNFYVVVLQLSVTISPATPTAVANVGTNCDTAGTSMIEGGATNANDFMELFKNILSTGATGGGGPACLFDQSATSEFRCFTATYSQKSAPNTTNLSPTGVTVSTLPVWSKVSGVRGAMQRSSSSSITTSGQTWYGVGMRRNGGAFALQWDVKFTTPGTLPTGNFQPITNFRVTWDRNLVN